MVHNNSIRKMIMFSSYVELLAEVQKNGKLNSASAVSINRSHETKELRNIQLEIKDFEQMLLDDKEVTYFEQELDWYLGRYEPKQNIGKKLRELAKEVLNAENRCGPNSNYGEMCLRLKNHIGVTQVDWIVGKLEKDKGSRQAIAFYNNPSYQYWSNDDFVCTLTQMFSIEDGKLDTTVNIRSNDLVNCFRFDSIWYRMFQKMVHEKLLTTYPDLKLGSMFFNIFSAHYYLKDEDKIAKIFEAAKAHSFKKVGEKYL